MPRDASELARRLARDAEAVCRHYLSKGRRQGRYWTVGDVRNTPGRSMFVRLSGPESGPGAAGHWTDAASAEHGDLLDVIRESCGLVDFRDVAEEARRFLSLPRAEPPYEPRPPAPPGSPEAARRLWAMSQPIHRHARRDVPAPSRDHSDPRCRRTAVPSTLLLSSGRQFADQDLAGDDRRRHRSLRHDHRRASHLACAGRLEQGAGRHAAARHGPSPRPRRPVRRGRRCPRCRRRSRDDAVATLRDARHADGGCAFRPTISPLFCSRRRCVGSISPATPMRRATWRSRH